MISVISPRAHQLRVGRSVTPLASLEGVALGLLSNSKPNASLLLDNLAGAISQTVRLKDVVRAAKQIPSSPAPEEVYEELERRCGAVIFASAD